MSATPASTAPASYDRVAQRTAALVIGEYSTSFGLASRLLARDLRTDIANIYALVRLADEIVDQPRQPEALASRARALTQVQEHVHEALDSGYSTNLVVHAFALTARACGIGADLVDPFFTSMRMDLDLVTTTPDTFDQYVYGSAEVVGLMCVRAFLRHEGTASQVETRYAQLASGAQALGAAFQKVNFLRDLADDYDRLGRSYFPGVDVTTFDEADKTRLLDDIDADLATAAAAIPLLPTSSRRAVLAAHVLFGELARRLRHTPATTIRHHRIRVPGPVKARLVATALVKGRP